MWLMVWLFLAWNLGAILKWGAQQDTSEVVQIGDYVVRMPCLDVSVCTRNVPMFAPSIGQHGGGGGSGIGVNRA